MIHTLKISWCVDRTAVYIIISEGWHKVSLSKWEKMEWNHTVLFLLFDCNPGAADNDWNLEKIWTWTSKFSVCAAFVVKVTQGGKITSFVSWFSCNHDTCHGVTPILRYLSSVCLNVAPLCWWIGGDTAQQKCYIKLIRAMLMQG